jgi:hypothetical protein
VAGWKGDKAWIDANTIMIRLKLPSVILNNSVIDSGQNDQFKKKFMQKYKGKLPFKTLPNWTTFLENFKAVATEDLQDYILRGTINKGTADYLKTLSKMSKREYCVQLMSLPEYQMC